MSHDGAQAARVVQASIAVSVVMVVPLAVIHRMYDSQLALAQAVDSFSDAFTGGAILYSLHVAARPPDANHPHGHTRAEPVAALLAAVLAGVLAIEVLRAAIGALYDGEIPQIGWPLAAAFAVKILAKLAIMHRARHHNRRTPGPAYAAIEIDARNDVLVCLLALAGFAAVRFGGGSWDAILAIPIAAWIAWSGISLANENIRLLMGEAAPAERHHALREVVGGVAGVLGTHDVVVRYDGTGLEVSAHVVVDATLQVREAHAISVAVKQRLLEEPDVFVAFVHLDPDDASEASSV